MWNTAAMGYAAEARRQMLTASGNSSEWSHWLATKAVDGAAEARKRKVSITAHGRMVKQAISNLSIYDKIKVINKQVMAAAIKVERQASQRIFVHACLVAKTSWGWLEGNILEK